MPPTERGIGRDALILLIVTVLAWSATVAYFWHGRLYRHSVRMPFVVLAAEVLLVPITAYFIARWWRTRRRNLR